MLKRHFEMDSSEKEEYKIRAYQTSRKINSSLKFILVHMSMNLIEFQFSYHEK